jgi:pimeloyl-ACP methyl ester carboxylesterase
VIRFGTTSEGVRLSYATSGEGPPLVRAAHWITHLVYDWHSPVWRHWVAGLARGRTLVRDDERGCGLSDHDVDEWSLDAFVHDLETVVDEAGLERFPLLGLSQGGPVAIAYADRHPERVSRLVLVGSYVQGRLRRAHSEEERREASDPRALARRLLADDGVMSLAFEEGALVVQTRQPDAFYQELTALAASGEAGAIAEVTSPDDNLQAVIKYLVRQ